MRHATCHPNRQHYAKTLCRSCWDKQRSDKAERSAKSTAKFKALPREEKERRWLRARLKRKYKITLERYQELVVQQGGLCAVCRKPGKLVIDHDHQTGKVRGLLHVFCNFVVGMVEQHGEVFVGATFYLYTKKERHNG